MVSSDASGFLGPTTFMVSKFCFCFLEVANLTDLTSKKKTVLPLFTDRIWAKNKYYYFFLPYINSIKLRAGEVINVVAKAINTSMVKTSGLSMPRS